MEGTQIGAYQIERQLGRGGFGVVYVGVDVRLGRRAAIKQLLPELSQRHEIVERFFNEARAAAAINHPGIVEIYEVGWHTDGTAFFAMKLLDGDSLAKRLRAHGMLSIPVATTIARQVASALTAAHARGIVHRDLKPDNIVLVPDEEIAIGERATVLDFGIAKLFGDQPTSQRTATGMMMGTPAYMSPEQCRGAGEVDHRTDVYALACILYEMLAGRPPFVGQGAGEVLGMHQFVETPMLRGARADVPEELEAVVMRALAKKPEARFQQMSELVTALQPFTTGAASTVHRAAFAPRPHSLIDPRAATMPSVDLRSQPTQRSIVEDSGDISSTTTMGSSSAELVKQPPAKSRAIWFAAGRAALAIAAGATAFAVLRDETTTAANAPPTASDAAIDVDASAVVMITPDTAPDAKIAEQQSLDPIPMPKPPVVNGAAANAMLIKPGCERALQAKDIAKLEDCATKLAKLDPEAAEKYRKAARAGAATPPTSAELVELDQALASNNFVLARSLAKRMGTAEAKRRYDTASDKAIIALENELKALALANDCEAHGSLLQERTRTHGLEIVRSAATKAPCKAATPPAPSEPPPPMACNAAVFVEKAKHHFSTAQYAQAHEQFALAYRCTKSPDHAFNAVLAACRANSRVKATPFFKVLDGNLRQKAVSVCLQNGIKLADAPDAGSGRAD